jgi:hypothetical protein
MKRYTDNYVRDSQHSTVYLFLRKHRLLAASLHCFAWQRGHAMYRCDFAWYFFSPKNNSG